MMAEVGGKSQKFPQNFFSDQTGHRLRKMGRTMKVIPKTIHGHMGTRRVKILDKKKSRDRKRSRDNETKPANYFAGLFFSAHVGSTTTEPDLISVTHRGDILDGVALP